MPSSVDLAIGNTERIGDHEKSLEYRRNMLSLYRDPKSFAEWMLHLSDNVRQNNGTGQRYSGVWLLSSSFWQLGGLAFGGDNELLGLVHNGNYLGTLEVIAHFDPF